MVVCPQAKCGSVNVVDLPHFWESLPAESPLKARYAPPAAVAASYWAALVVVVFGIAAVASGSVGLGLAVVAAGIVWGAVVHRQAAEAEARLERWRDSQVCLACTGQF